MFDLLKQYPARVYDYDSFTFWLNALGGFSISLSFILIGILFIIRAKKAEKEKYSRTRVRVTVLFGWFLVSCALSRAIDVLCMWHNFPVLSGYAKLLTGILAFIAIYYIPSLLKEASIADSLKVVKEELHETRKGLGKLQELTEKLEKDKDV